MNIRNLDSIDFNEVNDNQQFETNGFSDKNHGFPVV